MPLPWSWGFTPINHKYAIGSLGWFDLIITSRFNTALTLLSPITDDASFRSQRRVRNDVRFLSEKRMRAQACWSKERVRMSRITDLSEEVAFLIRTPQASYSWLLIFLNLVLEFQELRWLLAQPFRQYPDGIERRTPFASFKSSDLTCWDHAFIRKLFLRQAFSQSKLFQMLAKCFDIS